MVQTVFSEKNKKTKNKNKISKFKKRKFRKNQKLGFLRACACVKVEKQCIFPDVDAIKYQMMPFKGIFRPV